MPLPASASVREVLPAPGNGAGRQVSLPPDWKYRRPVAEFQEVVGAPARSSQAATATMPCPKNLLFDASRPSAAGRDAAGAGCAGVQHRLRHGNAPDVCARAASGVLSCPADVTPTSSLSFTRAQPLAYPAQRRFPAILAPRSLPRVLHGSPRTPPRRCHPRHWSEVLR